MMASAKRKKGGSARRVLRARDTYNAIYSSVSSPLSAGKHPPPRTLQPSRKSSAPFLPCFLLVLAPLWNRRFLLSSYCRAYPRHISTGFRHPDLEIHLEELPPSRGMGSLPARVSAGRPWRRHKFQPRPGKEKREEKTGDAS